MIEDKKMYELTNIDGYNDGFEDWEDDYNLIQKEDWTGLLKLRKERAKKNPNNIYDQWRYGEALVLNKKFNEAVEFLTPIYFKNPDFDDAIHTILDALYSMGKTENDFNWMGKPFILKLDKKTRDLCVDFLKNRRKRISLSEINNHLLIKGAYLTFNESELANDLMNDPRFDIIGDKSYFWDLEVKLSKRKSIESNRIK